MKRKSQKKRKQLDPVEQFMESAISTGNYRPFHCTSHGKFFFMPDVRPECPNCGELCFTPEEWAYRDSARQRRLMKVSMLRNNLER